jgi:glycosyltransferase involved in cell wall biosynthesis
MVENTYTISSLTGTKMKTYSKRIGFLVSYQTLVPHGGIGQFAKSFIEMMDAHGIKVDIITDKKPQNSEFVQTLNATIIYPDESLPYTEHSAIFMYGDSFCYERMANFRGAIIKAVSLNIYDSLVCNTYETIQVASTMGLDDCIQIVAYTHLESQIFKDTKNPFLPGVNEMMRLQLKMSNVYVGTQSKFNSLEFDEAYVLPIPMPEKGLLKEHHKPREGVLFIGRWEEGKNPELYLDLIEQTKLPARVMTNANGAKKFEERLKKMGADYKIAISIIGQEKVDFITGCRVAFNPSTVESYGIAFLEQMTQMPTVALDGMRWTNNFSSSHFYSVSKKFAAKEVLALYEQYPTAQSWYVTGSLAHSIQKDQSIFQKWNECFAEFNCKQSNSSTAKICQEKSIKYSDFIQALGRSIVCIDDVKSVLTNKHKFRVIYTDDDTYLTKDPSFEPTVSTLNTGLFDWT